MATPYKDRDPNQASTPEKRFKIIEAKLIARYEEVHGKEPEAVALDMISRAVTYRMVVMDMTARFLQAVVNGVEREWVTQFNSVNDRLNKLDAILFGVKPQAKTDEAESDWSDMVD